jgi:hypothetical protein
LKTEKGDVIMRFLTIGIICFLTASCAYSQKEGEPRSTDLPRPLASLRGRSGSEEQGLHPRLAVERGEQEMITVTGKLARVVAIGGETTGWAIQLDSPLEVEGKKLNSIEVDTGDNEEKANELENKKVQITGTLEKRYGVERGEYWVIAAKEIEEIKS